MQAGKPHWWLYGSVCFAESLALLEGGSCDGAAAAGAVGRLGVAVDVGTASCSRHACGTEVAVVVHVAELYTLYLRPTLVILS